ncbi:hypothetical protein QUF61_04035 [Candidatus Venteria ishoeyi]|uniref:hypothetical protein n=1 Tax=Candidatus Venteria ishoeyi TaxID=1899563 RepID=UPI0025A4D18D|nr:hypothetical protein [Candidatus Venteria ishoeyi]MDM8545645.1 hypothetical protein [Candidatus Venteria ishoeyi]
MSEDNSTIDCKEHGTCEASIVCRHLVNNNGAPLGFIENSSVPGDLQGWCYACEHLYLEEQSKTEKFKEFTNFAVVCSECYQKIKSHHDINT